MHKDNPGKQSYTIIVRELGEIWLPATSSSILANSATDFAAEISVGRWFHMGAVVL